MSKSNNWVGAISSMLAFSSCAAAAVPLNQEDIFLSGVFLEKGEFNGKSAFKVTMPKEDWQDPDKEILTDRAYMAWFPIDFSNGVIEVNIASQLADGAPEYARGFAGVSFRIQSDGSFENIYLRPTNSQSDDQVRRNHSLQYFSYPDYRFDRLRKESPEKYESYADIKLGEWNYLKIIVKNQQAVLYLNHNSSPSLIVNDLKLGGAAKGGVGIWIESGSEAWFTDLQIENNKTK